MANAQEQAKPKSNKLSQLEERYKNLFRDKKTYDSYFKNILPKDTYDKYSSIEIGKITLDMLLSYTHSKKNYTTQEMQCSIYDEQTIQKTYKDNENYIQIITTLNSKLVQLSEDLSNKTEELTKLRQKDELKITEEANFLLDKLKNGSEEREMLNAKYNSLVIEHNTLKMELQKRSKAIPAFRMKEMIDKTVATDFEYEVKQIKVAKDTNPPSQIQNFQLEYKMLLKEHAISKEKAQQLLIEKDKQISALRSEVKELQNKLSRAPTDTSRGNSLVLTEKALRKLNAEEELSNMRMLLDMHVQTEKELSEKIKHLSTKETVNVEYIKNIFLKYLLYTKCGRNVEMKMMLGILYDLFHVTAQEKDEVDKGKTGGVIWKAVKNANIDILSNVISGKPATKPTIPNGPYTRKVAKSVGDSNSHVNTKEDEEENKASFYK